MGAYNTRFNDIVNTDYTGGAITVGTSEQLASANGSSNLDDRQELIIYNNSSNTVYFGPTGVTTSSGIPLEPNETINVQAGDNINIYLIADSSGNSVIVQEFS